MPGTHFTRDHQQQSESWLPSGKGKGKEGDGWKGKGKGKWGDAGKSKGKGKYGKGYGKSGKGKGKRPMSSVDQAQYATMEEGACDWEHGGGGDDWTWDPAQQAGYMIDG